MRVVRCHASRGFGCLTVRSACDITPLQGDSLTGVLRLLRQVEDSTQDEVLRVHARAALGELNAITRQFMQPALKRPASVFLPSHFG